MAAIDTKSAAWRGVRLALFRRLWCAWRQQVRERRTLAQLGERDLRDLGLIRADLERELARPFWRRRDWTARH